jgi:hypothetical protein
MLYRLVLAAQTTRPPEGLARGRWPVPAWVVVGLACLISTSVIAFYLVRHRQRKRADRATQSTPTSSRR